MEQQNVYTVISIRLRFYYVYEKEKEKPPAESKAIAQHKSMWILKFTSDKESKWDTASSNGFHGSK